MTADAESFTHHVAQVWTWPEGESTAVHWVCQCGYKPHHYRIGRIHDEATPHQALREAHFNHVRKVRQRESADRNEPISA